MFQHPGLRFQQEHKQFQLSIPLPENFFLQFFIKSYKMKKKTIKQILFILYIFVFIILSYYLLILINLKYSDKISNVFWYILIFSYFILISIKFKNKKRLIISFMAFLIIALILLLFIPEFHTFIYNLFKWSSW